MLLMIISAWWLGTSSYKFTWEEVKRPLENLDTVNFEAGEDDLPKIERRRRSLVSGG